MSGYRNTEYRFQVKYNYYNLEVIFSSGPVMYGFRNMIGLYLL